MKLSQLRSRIFEPFQLGVTNSCRLPYWRKLEEHQWYDRGRLEEIQWQRLQELWHFIWAQNGFYRERFERAGLTEKSLACPGDISKLPSISKKEIRNNAGDMISKGYQKEKLLHFKTGGSTGKALDIFLTEQCSEMRNACARRHDRWAGWEPGEPIGAVWGNPKFPVSLKAKLKTFLVQPFIYLDTISVSDDSVRRFATDWARVAPTLLFGHAHSLFLLAQMVERLQLAEIRPAGIISTSMMLMPHERVVIEEVFKVAVTDRYGCEEVSLIASQCESHSGMHMNVEHLFIEFLREDGTSAAPGELANIVVTDLMNKAMPFVRYYVEDTGFYLDQSCSCGRGLPLMGKVTGRVADFLIRRDGAKIAGISLIENTLTAIPGIEQLQVVQESLDLLRLNVVPGAHFTHETEQALVGYFKGILGDAVLVKVERVLGIPPEMSGKYRFSICKVQEKARQVP